MRSGASFLQVFAACVLTGVVVATYLTDDATGSVVVAIVTVVVTLGPLWFRRLSLLSPSGLFLVTAAIAYGWTGLSMAQGYDPFLPIRPSLQQAVQPHQRAAEVVALVGIVAFLLGRGLTLAPPRKIEHRELTDAGRRRLRVYSMVLIVLGVGGLLVLTVSVGGMAALLENLSNRVSFFEGKNYLVSLFLLLPIGTVLLFVSRSPTHKPDYASLAIAVVGALFSVLNGSKTTLFVLILTLVVLWNRQYRKIPTWVVLVGAVVFMLYGVAYDLIFREFIPLGGEFVSVDRYSDLGEVVFTRGLGSSFFQLQALMIAIEYVPSVHPYYLGATFLSTLLSPLPRVLFPDKPTSPAGMFTMLFDPAFLEGGSTIPPSFFGELFMNGGVAVVCVGSFLLGVALRKLESSEQAQTGDVLQSLHFGLVAATMPLLVRGESFGPLVQYLAFAIPILIGRWVAFRDAADVGRPVPATTSRGTARWQGGRQTAA